ncbi:hypothetical protein C8R46DRAFT_484930 [Mycena filopes]|nr:hypothetical protein C8R46DRAFT_484930 [Mycena filopes]
MAQSGYPVRGYQGGDQDHPFYSNGSITLALEDVIPMLDWSNIFATLIPIRFPSPTVDELREKLSLGSIVGEFCQYRNSFYPVGYIRPPSAGHFRSWRLNESLNVRGHQEGNRFTFCAGTFNTAQISGTRQLLRASIRLTPEDRDTLFASWLSQANRCIGPSLVEGGIRYRYGVVDELSFIIVIDGAFKHLLRTEGITQEIHLFVYPVTMRTVGSRIGLDAPQWDRVYWSTDPTGLSPLSQDDADAMGLPRLKFHFFPTANFWHEYHYSALREFAEAKALDPYGDGLARILGFPLAQMETDLPQ